MLLEFKTADGSIFVADNTSMRWGRVDKPAREPDSQILEAGILTLQSMAGFGMTFALSPRTEQSTPGNGLCTILLMIANYNNKFRVYLGANTELSLFTLAIPIDEVTYHIIPTNPANIDLPDPAFTNQEIFEKTPTLKFVEAASVPSPVIDIVAESSEWAAGSAPNTMGLIDPPPNLPASKVVYYDRDLKEEIRAAEEELHKDDWAKHWKMSDVHYASDIVDRLAAQEELQRSLPFLEALKENPGIVNILAAQGQEINTPVGSEGFI